MNSLKRALFEKTKPVLLGLAVILSVSVGNLVLQFFLRFLLRDWGRVAWISALVYLAFFPLVLWLLKQAEKFFPIKKIDRLILILLSLVVGGLFYLRFPIKITGSLLLLESAPLWLYRISRLANIISLILAAAFSFFMLMISLAQKTAGRRLWWFAAIAFFTLLLVVGLLVYKDYGISSDEPNERTSGLVSANYVASYITEPLIEPNPYIPRLSTYRYRYYGVAYQMPLAFMENNTLTRGQEVWHLRHLANFMAFYLGVLAFFHLSAEFFEDPRCGLLAALFLTLSPRLFAHAFFNPKDTVFMAAFIIALYFSARFWRHRTFWAAALAGLTAAFAANIRVIALALAVLTVGMLLLDLINKQRKPAWRQTLLCLAVFLAFLILFWPAAWENPLATLGQAIRLFSDYAYWDFRVMYLGEFMPGAQAPWHYLPVWMGITIPLPYILLFFIGFISWIGFFLRKGSQPLRDHQGRLRLVFLGILLVPPLLAILLNSTLYNGWRHFQFIYPAFIVIAAAGVRTLASGIDLGALWTPKTILSLLVLVMAGMAVIWTGVWMVRFHPNQAVYFNRLGHLAGRENFERDYWRISAKQGFEYLLRQAPSDNIAVCIESQFAQPEFLMILPEAMRARIDLITNPAYFDACDYTVNTYRNPEAFLCEIPFYEISVEGLPILTIARCNQP